MSDGFNRVMLLGNLGADPELKMTQGGQAVLKLRLATSERYQDRDGVWKDHTEWHSVVVWGKRAEALHKFLAKGSNLFVEGSLRTSSYEDRDGVKRYKTEIKASNIVLTGRGAARSAAPIDEEGPGAPPPAQAPRARAAAPAAPPDDMPPEPPIPDGDDDLPF